MLNRRQFLQGASATGAAFLLGGCMEGNSGTGGEGAATKERGMLYKITSISDAGVAGARLDLVDAAADPDSLEYVFAQGTSCYVADGSMYQVGQTLYKDQCK